MKAKITAKGQITLPVSLRRKKGWRPGTVLEFTGTGTAVTVRESKTQLDPRCVIGCLKSGSSEVVAEIIDDLRGPVELPSDR